MKSSLLAAALLGLGMLSFARAAEVVDVQLEAPNVRRIEQNEMEFLRRDTHAPVARVVHTEPPTDDHGATAKVIELLNRASIRSRPYRSWLAKRDHAFYGLQAEFRTFKPYTNGEISWGDFAADSLDGSHAYFAGINLHAPLRNGDRAKFSTGLSRSRSPGDGDFSIGHSWRLEYRHHLNKAYGRAFTESDIRIAERTLEYACSLEPNAVLTVKADLLQNLFSWWAWHSSRVKLGEVLAQLEASNAELELIASDDVGLALRSLRSPDLPIPTYAKLEQAEADGLLLITSEDWSYSDNSGTDPYDESDVLEARKSAILSLQPDDRKQLWSEALGSFTEVLAQERDLLADIEEDTGSLLDADQLLSLLFELRRYVGDPVSNPEAWLESNAVDFNADVKELRRDLDNLRVATNAMHSKSKPPIDLYGKARAGHNLDSSVGELPSLHKTVFGYHRDFQIEVGAAFTFEGTSSAASHLEQLRLDQSLTNIALEEEEANVRLGFNTAKNAYEQAVAEHTAALLAEGSSNRLLVDLKSGMGTVAANLTNELNLASKVARERIKDEYLAGMRADKSYADLRKSEVELNLLVGTFIELSPLALSSGPMHMSPPQAEDLVPNVHDPVNSAPVILAPVHNLL